MNFSNEYNNNTINENKLNSKKARSTKHQIKQLLKPILAAIKRNTTNNNNNNNKKKNQKFAEPCEIEDNYANELLEARIFEEIDSCGDCAAVPIYEDGVVDVLPIVPGQSYIPVHFAKTEAGTFFWTSIVGADSDIAYHGAITNNQLPELQVACDRWAQA